MSWNIVMASVAAFFALLSAGGGFFLGRNDDPHHAITLLTATVGIPSLVVMIIAIWAWRKIQR